MSAIIVIACIFLGFYLIGCIRPHVIISMHKYMNIYVKVFFIKVRVSTSQKFDPPDEELDLPKKQKKPKKPKPKKTKKPKVKKDKKEPKKPGLLHIGVDIPKMLVMVRDVLGALFLKLWRYFRVRIKNFHITVASADAAQTAMMYGVICGYGDAIMKILEKALDFKIEKGARVGADIDYLSEEMKIDAEIDISISIGGVFRYLFGIIGAAVAGALRGLKIGLNKKFFSQKSQYKRDIKEYREKKAIEDAKKAEKEAAKEAKKAEKEAKKAAKAAESGENAEAQNEEIKPAQDAEENNENETKNEVLVAETPEREINNGTEE
ncbi:MAG: hypothetical protein IJW76_06000 [Clostridia bacterium]|nr:hypothetical protein [Clostridia bacterium]